MKLFHGRTGSLAILLSALSACGEPVTSSGAGTCAIVSEWGNGGCLLIEGEITGLQGQPLQGVSFGGPRPTADGQVFTGAYGDTDAAGHAAIRIFQLTGTGRPSDDSVSLWIRAAVVPVPPAATSTIIDSVFIRAMVTPVGQVPSPIKVRIQLAVAGASTRIVVPPSP